MNLKISKKNLMRIQKMILIKLMITCSLVRKKEKRKKCKEKN